MKTCNEKKLKILEEAVNKKGLEFIVYEGDTLGYIFKCSEYSFGFQVFASKKGRMSINVIQSIYKHSENLNIKKANIEDFNFFNVSDKYHDLS